MWHWFKKRKTETPNYWRAYEDLFIEKASGEVAQTAFTVFDTETTGFDYEEDRILCIGAVTVQHSSIDVVHSFEEYLYQEKFRAASVKIHGILKNEKVPKLSEEEAIKKFIAYIGDSVLVAHHAQFDITMINQALKRLNLPKLKNQVLDTGRLYRASRLTSNLIDSNRNYSLDDLADAFNIDVQDRHTAAGDAYITAIAFLKILSRLNKSDDLKVKDLLQF